MDFVRLNNGVKMPIIGLGTYPLNKFKLVKSVVTAYRNGCMSFDTSSAYGNEKWLGRSLKIIKFLGAKNIFITTKLSNSEQRKGDVRTSLRTSMKNLGVSQIDLYLMHWPNPETYLDSWKQMEELYKEGLVKAIGVCNFHEHHLQKLLEIADVVPMINQVEIHPLFTQKPLREYCTNLGIKVQAYSPIARMHQKLVDHPTLIKLAKKYDKTVPQVILRWDIQNEIITIPKSGNKIRIMENFNIFDFTLSSEEIKMINDLNEDFRVRFNPDTVDYNKV